MDTTIQPNSGQEVDAIKKVKFCAGTFYNGFHVVVMNVAKSWLFPQFERAYDVAGVNSIKNDLFANLTDAIAFVYRNAAAFQVDNGKEEIVVFSSWVTEPSVRDINGALTFIGKRLYDHLGVRKFTSDESGKLMERDFSDL